MVTIGGNRIRKAHDISTQPLSNNGSDRPSLGIVLQRDVADLNKKSQRRLTEKKEEQEEKKFNSVSWSKQKKCGE